MRRVDQHIVFQCSLHVARWLMIRLTCRGTALYNQNQPEARQTPRSNVRGTGTCGRGTTDDGRGKCRQMQVRKGLQKYCVHPAGCWEQGSVGCPPSTVPSATANALPAMGKGGGGFWLGFLVFGAHGKENLPSSHAQWLTTTQGMIVHRRADPFGLADPSRRVSPSPT